MSNNLVYKEKLLIFHFMLNHSALPVDLAIVTCVAVTVGVTLCFTEPTLQSLITMDSLHIFFSKLIVFLWYVLSQN
jgi:hypothetical protein